MAINLKELKPHKISRDLTGYITYIYGKNGTGKTTMGAQFPKPLILAFERGYNALPGVYAQDKMVVVTAKRGTKNQKPFNKMILMQCKLEGIGIVKLTVGIRRSNKEKVQYCITVISA